MEFCCGEEMLFWATKRGWLMGGAIGYRIAYGREEVKRGRVCWGGRQKFCVWRVIFLRIILVLRGMPALVLASIMIVRTQWRSVFGLRRLKYRTVIIFPYMRKGLIDT